MLLLLVLQLSKFVYLGTQQMGNSALFECFKSGEFHGSLKISHKISESKHTRTII